MARFDTMQGIFGLLPTPYDSDYEIITADLRAAADFCCRSGQHGIVWPVMVGEFYFLGEQERIRHLDELLVEIDGRLPLVFGCSGVSLPQVLHFARAANKAGVDAIIAMAPARTDQQIAMDMYRRMAEVYDGPIMLQNADQYAPLRGEQIAQLIDEVPQIEYIKEERQPGPKHIAEVYDLVGDKVKCIFGGAGGRFLPAELRRGATGCMPACEWADVLTRIFDLWQNGDEAAARNLHCRLLPLINLETIPYMRYILHKRGVFSSLIERAPAGALVLDEGDRREIDILVQAIEQDIAEFPFLVS